MHDIWRVGAPAIDILAPDIYLPQFTQIIQTFARNGNPAFNPETRQDANACSNAFTELNLPRMKAAKPASQIKRFVHLFGAHASEDTPGFFFRHCLKEVR